MRNYVYSIRVLFIMAFISFVLLFFVVNSAYDIMLAIFGSSFVSLIISIIGYRTLRTDTLEDFYSAVGEHLHYWTLFDSNDDINKKCEYFMNYYVKDFPDIGHFYGRIYFLFDFRHKIRNRIYYNIYKPCVHLSNTIINHYWHFKWHMDGTGRNYEIITEMINDIENEIIDKKNGTDIIIKVSKELNDCFIKILSNVKKEHRDGDSSEG